MDKYGKSTHDLDYIKALMARGRFDITRSARRDAVRLGYPTDEDIVSRVLKISSTEIYKTMSSNEKKGLWQDVYRTKEEDGTDIYVKLQISPIGESVVISFKEK